MRGRLRELETARYVLRESLVTVLIFGALETMVLDRHLLYLNARAVGPGGLSGVESLLCCDG